MIWPIIILLLVIIIVILSIVLLIIVKKTIYISDKDKEFIKFTIDMYINYAEDLEINSKEQHEKIVEELERIKNKYFENEFTGGIRK